MTNLRTETALKNAKWDALTNHIKKLPVDLIKRVEIRRLAEEYGALCASVNREEILLHLEDMEI